MTYDLTPRERSMIAKALMRYSHEQVLEEDAPEYVALATRLSQEGRPDEEAPVTRPLVLSVPERAFLTGLVAQHNLDTPPGHDTHRLLLRKLKLTLEEWESTDERLT